MGPRKGDQGPRRKAAKGDAQPDTEEPDTAEDKAAGAAKPGMENAVGASKSDGSSDSDDSDSGDIDVDAATAQQLMALEQELETSPSFEKHLEYVNLVRATPGLRNRLREAHEALSSRYPLSEELWLGWVNDELAGVSGPEDVSYLLGLLRLAATRDYLAPAVWELYLQVARDLDPAVQELSPAGVDRYRTLCEEAVAAAGLHLAAGHRLWEKYRKFELEVEAKVTGSKGPTATSVKQQDRLRALYQRQLQIPLLDVAATLEEYRAWEAGHGKSVPPHVVKAADKAREAAEVRAGCEAAVAPEAPSDVAKLGAFMAYIKMEQKSGDSARVQVLYERAVAAFPLTHILWLEYGQYMETHTKLPGPINNVYSRAVRNCPWLGGVWERAIRALDLTGAAPEAVEEMYDEALHTGLQGAEDVLAVILARLDYLRRAAVTAAAAAAAAGGGGAGKAAAKQAAAAFTTLRGAFTSASELMMSQFPDFVDRTLRLPAYWARCEVHVMSDRAAAREVWEGALKGGIGRYAEAWEAYIAMEREARLIKEARTLYKRCCSRHLEEGGQLRLCHEWLRFEREEGSADDYLQALLKVEPVLEESAAAAAAAADQSAAAVAKAAVQQAKVLSKEEVKAMRRAKDPNFKDIKPAKVEKGGKSGKRERQDDGKEAAASDGNEAALLASNKRIRIRESELAAVMGTAAAVVPPDAPAGAPVPAHDGAAAAADGDAEMADHPEATAAPVAGASGATEEGGEEHAAGPGPGATSQAGSRPRYLDQNTVFIKGLRHGLKDKDLDAFLKQHVPEGIKDVRIVRDHETGLAKGYAYVECGSKEALNKAVELNGTSFQGISLFIAESKPPGPGASRGGGAGGRFSGAGRGGRFGGSAPGGRGGGGRGRFGGGGRGSEGGDGDHEMADAGDGGGHDGPGGRGGGRHQGLGYSGGRGGRHQGPGHPSGRGAMRTHLQVAPGSAAPTALVPRSVQLAQGGGGAADGAPAQPMSNDDFRKMLLGGKK